MKTFNDLKVGDYFYELDRDIGTLYRNKITGIDISGEEKVFIWIDNNDSKGSTFIPFTKTNKSVYMCTFIIVCATAEDVVNVLCNS